MRLPHRPDFPPRALLGVFFALLAPVLSAADTPGPGGRPAPTGWAFSVGGGMMYAPAFPGSSDYQLDALPNLRATYGDRFFASVQEGVGYNWLQSEGWVAGPLLGIDFGRDADGRSPFRIAGSRSTALLGFEDIDTTLQAGGFLGYETGPWASRLELLRGVNGHEGTTATLDLSHRTLLGLNRQAGGPPTTLSTGPRVQWADSSYRDAYFGITPADALATGLPAYRVGSGFASVGWGASVIHALQPRWVLVALANYERLLGDVADSPLVRQRGSANQFTVGVFVSYSL